MADLDCVHHRPVINIIGAVEINDLLYRSRINASESADAFEQVLVGSRVVHGPLAGPRASAPQAKARIVRITEYIGVAKTCPHPFVLLHVPIRGKRKIFVLDRRVLFKRPLRVQHAPGVEKPQQSDGECGPVTHAIVKAGFRITPATHQAAAWCSHWFRRRGVRDALV